MLHHAKNVCVIHKKSKKERKEKKIEKMNIKKNVEAEGFYSTHSSMNSHEETGYLTPSRDTAKLVWFLIYLFDYSFVMFSSRFMPIFKPFRLHIKSSSNELNMGTFLFLLKIATLFFCSSSNYHRTHEIVEYVKGPGTFKIIWWISEMWGFMYICMYVFSRRWNHQDLIASPFSKQ